MYKETAFPTPDGFITALSDTTNWKTTTDFGHIKRLCGGDPKALITPIKNGNDKIKGKTPMHLAIEYGLKSSLLFEMLSHATIGTMAMVEKLKIKLL